MGLKTKFFSVPELVLKLAETRKQGTLEKLVKDLQKQDLLILDEWGYVPVDRDGSQMLFRIVSDSYERKSLILTTNLEFSKWGSVFTDEQMAAAMIDRLAHHGHLLMAGGRSFRMEHALMRQDAVVESASCQSPLKVRNFHDDDGEFRRRKWRNLLDRKQLFASVYPSASCNPCPIKATTLQVRPIFSGLLIYSTASPSARDGTDVKVHIDLSNVAP